jgi:hypothetical protein
MPGLSDELAELASATSGDLVDALRTPVPFPPE